MALELDELIEKLHVEQNKLDYLSQIFINSKNRGAVTADDSLGLGYILRDSAGILMDVEMALRECDEEESDQ